ncbi:MAG: zinc ribbon domain-containing protein [Clostridia bacterium]|nr:zinc ribbon domain-containing protein [Clostridia bacterium]
MFNNPGGKLKEYGYTVFIIGIIVSVISGIVIWTNGNLLQKISGGSIGGFNFWIFIVGAIIIAVGIFGSYILAIFIVSFGELVENSTILVNLETSQVKQSTLVSHEKQYKKCNICGAINDGDSYTCSECGSGLPKSKISQSQMDKTSATGSFVFCPKCNTENSKSAKYCCKCGTKLK